MKKNKNLRYGGSGVNDVKLLDQGSSCQIRSFYVRCFGREIAGVKMGTYGNASWIWEWYWHSKTFCKPRAESGISAATSPPHSFRIKFSIEIVDLDPGSGVWMTTSPDN